MYYIKIKGLVFEVKSNPVLRVQKLVEGNDGEITVKIYTKNNPYAYVAYVNEDCAKQIIKTFERKNNAVEKQR